MKITDFQLIGADGVALNSDAFGNNVAFNCIQCRHPILAILRPNQRGSSIDAVVECRGCQSGYYLDVDESMKRLMLKVS